MRTWGIPPKAKIFEAFSVLADRRVRIAGDRKAEVTSSDGHRHYMVQWDAGMRIFSSTDNSSKWQGVAGYPIIAVLMLLKVLPFDEHVLPHFKGIPWKELNDRARRNHDKVVEQVLKDLAKAGVDTGALCTQVDRIHDRLVALQLQRPQPGGKVNGPPPIPDK
jgi:hypothetical protein